MLRILLNSFRRSSQTKSSPRRSPWSSLNLEMLEDRTVPDGTPWPSATLLNLSTSTPVYNQQLTVTVQVA